MIKPAVKTIYYSALSTLRADRRRLRELKQTGQTAILNFHRVSPDPNPYWSPLHPDVFEDLARWLSANFSVSTFNVVDRPSGEKPRVILSFDDGYYDFLEYALPILEKYGLPANMNVIPECAETGKPIWNVQLYDFLRSALPSEVSRIQLPGFEVSLSGGSSSAKLRYGLAVSRFLKNRPREERSRIWQQIAPIVDNAGSKSTRMMSTEEIKQIAGRVELGAHSYSHESMGFESDEFFLDDLGRCESYFNDKLRIPLTIYAFPNGSYRPSQIDLLKKRGVEHVLLVDEKFAKANGGVHTRMTMYGDSLSEVKFKALGY